MTGGPVEGMTGIEPAWPVWKTGALPLSYIPALRTCRSQTIVADERVPNERARHARARHPQAGRRRRAHDPLVARGLLRAGGPRRDRVLDAPGAVRRSAVAARARPAARVADRRRHRA